VNIFANIAKALEGLSNAIRSGLSGLASGVGSVFAEGSKWVGAVVSEAVSRTLKNLGEFSKGIGLKDIGERLEKLSEALRKVSAKVVGVDRLRAVGSVLGEVEKKLKAGLAVGGLLGAQFAKGLADLGELVGELNKLYGEGLEKVSKALRNVPGVGEVLSELAKKLADVNKALGESLARFSRETKKWLETKMKEMGKVMEEGFGDVGKQIYSALRAKVPALGMEVGELVTSVVPVGAVAKGLSLGGRLGVKALSRVLSREGAKAIAKELTRLGERLGKEVKSVVRSFRLGEKEGIKSASRDITELIERIRLPRPRLQPREPPRIDLGKIRLPRPRHGSGKPPRIDVDKIRLPRPKPMPIRGGRIEIEKIKLPRIAPKVAERSVKDVRMARFARPGPVRGLVTPPDLASLAGRAARLARSVLVRGLKKRFVYPLLKRKMMIKVEEPSVGKVVKLLREAEDINVSFDDLLKRFSKVRGLVRELEKRGIEVPGWLKREIGEVEDWLRRFAKLRHPGLEALRTVGEVRYPVFKRFAKETLKELDLGELKTMTRRLDDVLKRLRKEAPTVYRELGRELKKLGKDIAKLGKELEHVRTPNWKRILPYISGSGISTAGLYISGKLSEKEQEEKTEKLMTAPRAAAEAVVERVVSTGGGRGVKSGGKVFESDYVNGSRKPEVREELLRRIRSDVVRKLLEECPASKNTH